MNSQSSSWITFFTSKQTKQSINNNSNKDTTNQDTVTNNNNNNSNDNNNDKYDDYECGTIDDALQALSGWKITATANTWNNSTSSTVDEEYDWLLDGLVWMEEESSSKDTEESSQRQQPQSLFGDVRLDSTLNGLELETSFSTCNDETNNSILPQQNELKEYYGSDDDNNGEFGSIEFSLPQFQDDCGNNLEPNQTNLKNYRLETTTNHTKSVTIEIMDSQTNDNNMKEKTYQRLEEEIMEFSNQYYSQHEYDPPPTTTTTTTTTDRMDDSEEPRRIPTILSDLEHKFYRRLHHHHHHQQYQYQSPKSDVGAIALDTVVHTLQQVFASSWPQRSEEELIDVLMDLDEYITIELCTLQEKLQKVNQLLVQEIHTHQPSLEESIHTTRHIQDNITATLLYNQTAQDCLHRTQHYTNEQLDFVQYAHTKTNYTSLQTILKNISYAHHLEHLIHSQQQQQQQQQSSPNVHLVQYAQELHTIVLECPILSNLYALQPMRERISTIHTTIRTQILHPALQQQQPSGIVSYNNLMQVLLPLATREVQLQENVSLEQIASEWGNTLVEGLCFQANRAVADSLFPTSPVTNFEDELKQMKSQLQQMTCSSCHNLRSLTQNLYSIQFEFSPSSTSSISSMFKTLCQHLSQLIYNHSQIYQWHYQHHQQQQQTMKSHSIAEDTSIDNHDELLSFLLSKEAKKSKEEIWNHMESVLISFLEQYTYYCDKQQLTLTQDLLQDIYILSLQMVYMANEYLDYSLPDSNCIELSISRLGKQIKTLGCHYLHITHKEAMTTMGAMLANETWQLTLLQLQQSEKIQETIASLIQSKSRNEKEDRMWENLVSLVMIQNHSAAQDEHKLKLFTIFEEYGNPFGIDIRSISSNNKTITAAMESSTTKAIQQFLQNDNNNDNINNHAEQSSQGKEQELYQYLDHLKMDDQNIPILTHSARTGLVKWTSQLCNLMEDLPILAEDIAIVLTNLFDLYILTVFRLCAGTAKNEQILLGAGSRAYDSYLMQQQQLLLKNHVNGNHNKSKKSKTKKGKKQSKTNHANNMKPSFPKKNIVASIEADVCAPLCSEADSIGRLRDFIRLGQESLSKMVDLDKMDDWLCKQTKENASILVQQVAAAASCLFVAALIDATVQKARKNLTQAWKAPLSPRQNVETCVTESLISLSLYSRQAVAVIPSLSVIATRIAAANAVKTKTTVLEVRL